jgi:hypothetical protein
MSRFGYPRKIGSIRGFMLDFNRDRGARQSKATSKKRSKRSTSTNLHSLEPERLGSFSHMTAQSSRPGEATSTVTFFLIST